MFPPMWGRVRGNQAGGSKEQISFTVKCDGESKGHQAVRGKSSWTLRGVHTIRDGF